MQTEPCALMKRWRVETSLLTSDQVLINLIRVTGACFFFEGSPLPNIHISFVYRKLNGLIIVISILFT